MGRKEYIIRFGGLKAGVHEYSFKIKDTFFKGNENSEIQRADLDVKAELTRQNNLMQMRFEVNGTVDVDCDRCLKTFGYPVTAEETLVIKHGDTSESTDEILVIPEGQEEFDVSQYLFEYISLALPARRVPCELDKKKFHCDYAMLEKLSKLSAPEEQEEETNPMWEKLSKLKFNNN